jgi:hypothetical protein
MELKTKYVEREKKQEQRKSHRVSTKCCLLFSPSAEEEELTCLQVMLLAPTAVTYSVSQNQGSIDYNA